MTTLRQRCLFWRGSPLPRWSLTCSRHSLWRLNRQRLLLAVTAFGLVVNLATNLTLIPRYGAVAAAAATLATEIAVTVPLMIVAAAQPPPVVSSHGRS